MRVRSLVAAVILTGGLVMAAVAVSIEPMRIEASSELDVEGPGGDFVTFAHGWARGRSIVGPFVNVAGMSARDPVRVRIEVRDKLNSKRADIFYNVTCIGPGITFHRDGNVSVDPPWSIGWVIPEAIEYCLVDTRAAHDFPGWLSVRNRAAY